MSAESFSLIGVESAVLERALAFVERLSAFRHERALPVESWKRSGGTLELLCPTPEHVTLATWLEREQRLPFLECGRVLAELAEVLSAAHATGIAHGDLDSAQVLWSNVHVLVDGFGRVQLRALLEGQDSASAFVDDVQAFGALAYQVVTGNVFVSGAPPPNALREHVPPGLAALIVRCLEQDPARRPRAEDIARFTAGLVTPASNWRAPMLVRQAEYLLTTEPSPWKQTEARLMHALAIDPNSPAALALAERLAAVRTMHGIT